MSTKYLSFSIQGEFITETSRQKLFEKYERNFDVNIVMEDDFNKKCNEFDMTDVQTEFDFEDEVNSKLDGVIWD